MNFYTQLFWRLFIRKETPANVPASQGLLVLLCVVSMLISIVVAINNIDALFKSIAGNIIDLIILALFAHIVLDLYKRRARFLQVFVALLGIRIVFQIFTLPGVLYISTVDNIREPNALLALISLFMLVLLITTLRAIAHTLTMALEITHFKAVMYSVGYYMINLFITVQLFAGAQAEAVP